MTKEPLVRIIVWGYKRKDLWLSKDVIWGNDLMEAHTAEELRAIIQIHLVDYTIDGEELFAFQNPDFKENRWWKEWLTFDEAIGLLNSAKQ